MSQDEFVAALAQVMDHITTRHTTLSTSPPISTRESIDSALTALPPAIPSNGLGVTDTIRHLINDIAPGLLQGHAGSRFFGLVTGGVTPASQLADILGSSCTSVLPISDSLR
jgi:hypothetical protein